MYKVEVKLNHNEVAAKVNTETGDTKLVKFRPNNIPDGKSKLSYKKFAIVNNDSIKILSDLLSNEELGIVLHMIGIAEFNTNSLKPLNDSLSLRELEAELKISKNRVKPILEKLFKLGVYMQVKIHEEDLKEFWVLNPYISWKGNLKTDSLFDSFMGTVIAKLLRE